MTDNTQMKETLQNWFDGHREEIMADWKELVDIPSHVSNRAEGDVLCRRLSEIFETLGMKVQVFEAGPGNAPTITGIWREDLPGKPVIFSGHYDTVDLQGDHPFRIDEEGHVHGLGALDMKAGIVMSIWILKALQAQGFAERPVRFLFAGDEECGHKGGCAAETLRQEAAGALCAFNMETGLISNKICIGRKGAAFACVKTEGVAAHAGNDFESGRNAIAAMALKITKFQALTDLSKGTSVSCNTISGGTVVNGIPGSCELWIDSRYTSLSERERVFTALQKITEETEIEGCSASHIGMAGVPVICSMGVQGEFNHTAREYAIPETLFKRMVLLAAAVMRIEELKF